MNSNYQKLNQYRLSRRQSISELARNIGISLFTLRKILRGEATPRDYTAAAINDWMDDHADEIRAAVEG